MDVAQALNNLVQLPALAQTLNLPGPSTLTYEYLLDLVASITYQPPSRAPTVPKAVALAISKASDRKSTRLNSSHLRTSRMPSSA